LESACGIICNSQATVEELNTFAEAERLETPPIVASWISGQVAKRPTVSVNPSRPYFVALGTIEGRKNHELLLDVWNNLIEERGQDIVPDLVIVGQRGWKAEGIIELLDDPERFGRHVRELGSCEDEELAELLSGATALLMPSLAEGFGLPIIEALQLGTPIIASELTVFREIAGEIPQFLDPTDVGAWTEAIVRFLGDEREGAKQRLLMAAYRPPTWETHFAVVEPWLNELTLRPELTDA
jgi:glycosyltransferase involved in cell wall biosynthesis